MAQLQIPLSIWLASTPDERDGFYLSAGFDPNLPVIDNGTDTMTVRFRQDPPQTPVPVVSATAPQAGDDLRDFQNVGFTPGDFAEFGNGAAPPGEEVAGAGLAIAGRTLRLILGGGGGRLTAAIWNSLPSVVRTALTQVGIGVGALIAFNGDIPFITLPGQGSGLPVPLGPELPPVDIQVGGHLHALGVTIIGSWNTNPTNPAMGVTFYRLSDGKLAVQNKKGRWKVWKPKRPIVLYAGGASNLKTMLRADKALNKQAKKIAAMLNRRAPRRKSAATSAPNPIILGNNARVVDV